LKCLGQKIAKHGGQIAKNEERKNIFSSSSEHYFIIIIKNSLTFS
jgi:hypothetical protein